MIRILFVLVRNLLANFFIALYKALRLVVWRSHGVDYVKVELRGAFRLRRERAGRPAWLVRMLRGPQLETTEEELSETVRAVAEDPHVRGLVVVLRDGKLGFAQLAGVRARLLDLRARGKEVVVWAADLSTGGYYLASAASHVALAPGGHVDLRGLAAEVRFYKGLLDKVPARAEVIAAGRYKNAFDPFSRESMTPEHREALGSVLDDLAAQILDGIATGRSLSAEEVRARIDDGPYMAKRALEARLVDSLAYEDELDERLRPAASPPQKKKAVLCTAKELAAKAPPVWSWRPLLRPRCVGVVAVRGTIHSGESRAAPFSGPTAGDRTVCAALEAARKNKRVRAVVLYVDSRGGSSLASDLMWRAVERVRAEKPVVACFGNYAASGGYYVATGCDRIFASPGTITGSIGVLAGKLDLSGLWSRLGVKVEVLRRGARGDLYSTHRSLDDAERARLEADISAVYDDFVSRVADGRKLSHEAVHDVAQGRVWTGARALEHKLVDALGTFDDALAHAKERAGFRAGAKPPVVLFSGPSRGPLAFLTRGALAETPIPATDLARVLGLDLPSLEELSLLADARELLWWPHEIDAS